MGPCCCGAARGDAIVSRQPSARFAVAPWPILAVPLLTPGPIHTPPAPQEPDLPELPTAPQANAEEELGLPAIAQRT
jgi:hypothetical protein